MSPQLLALVLVGLGVYLVVTSVPFGEGRAPLVERLRRFDVDLLVNERRHEQPARQRMLPWPAADAVLWPLFEDLAEPVRRLLHGSGLFGGELEDQLRTVWPETRPVEFVARQLLAGGAAALGVITALVAAGAPASTAIVIGLAGFSLGFLAPRALLAAEGRARRRRIETELPQVVWLLVGARSAGLALDACVERVARASVGPLGRGLREARAQVGGGRHLVEALEHLAVREDVPELTDLVSRLRATDEHGLPLVQALEDLAVSTHEKAVNRLLEAGEKGGLKALLPLGLLMVPVSVIVMVTPAVLVMLGQVRP
jgi:tight adherence protein C